MCYNAGIMKLNYKVKKEDSNKTINQILDEQFHFSTRLKSKLVKSQMVLINGIFKDTRFNCFEGDNIIVDLDYPESNDNIVSKKMSLDIIYEDDAMLILNKPVGIPVHPSLNHYEDSLASGVKFYFESQGINKKTRPVNRLDLNTSRHRYIRKK